MRICKTSSQYSIVCSQKMWFLCVLALLVWPASSVPDSDNVSRIPLDLSPEVVNCLTLLPSEKQAFLSQTGITANINDYIEKLLFSIQKLLIRDGFDPMELPDQHQGFSKKIIFITYHGEFDLSRGWLQDAATVKLIGNAAITYQPSTKKLLIEIPIGFDDLMFTYKYSLKFMNLGPVGGIDGKISKVKINTAIEIDLNTFSAKVQKFSVVNSGHIDIEFTGHILTDWILDMMSEMTTTLLHNVILGIVSGVVKSGLDIAVNDINKLLSEILNSTAPLPPEKQHRL